MRADLPGGMVTFLFTDLEGSTRLLRELGAPAYRDVLAEHRRIVRAVCRSNAGVEVDTQGDAFFLAFGSASGAARAAEAIVAALAGGPLRLRCGVHTGTPLVTDEGYVGEDVHIAARVAAAAHGGQIVLTKTTLESLDDRAGWIDLGEHHLRDIADPMPLYQLGMGSFPPLRTPYSSNLPRPASSFVGRRRELAAIAAHIERGARLVTLTGPGGTGKTRLALQAAALLPAYAGVFWVDLAPLREATLVMSTVAQALGAKVALSEHIGEREMLIVLDNMEQVIEAAPDLSALISACGGLTLLVTSREVLRVQGEVEYRVPPLDEGEAVHLFTERSGLDPTPDIAELCARLDDLPLAIELAAARARVLSPGQILDRLAGRLDLLKGGRDVDPRQATLRATIEWSHDLLSPEERILFRRLAVFSGGWTLEAGEAIVDADVDGLQSLVEKSIVRMSGERYRMLETIREYAVEQLEATEGSTQLRHRHARWFASFVERAERELEGAGQDAWMARLAEEHDNVRAALDRALAEDDPDLALRIAGAAATFWWVQGHWVEGRRWLNAALSHPGRQDEAMRARALEGAANLDVRLWDWAAARPRADESLAISRSLGDQRAIARAHRVVGLVDWGEDDPEGFRRHTEDSASAARLAGDAWALSMALNNLGYLALAADDVDAAAPLFQEAVDLARARGDHRSEAFYLENAGLARLAQGATDVARLDFEASLVIARRLGFLEVEATDLIGLAAIASNTGAPERAAVLVGAADLIVEETGGRLDPVESSVRDRAVAEVERHIGHAALASTMAIGRSIRRDQVIDVALGDEWRTPS